jgi:hypothetical protein
MEDGSFSSHLSILATHKVDFFLLATYMIRNASVNQQEVPSFLQLDAFIVQLIVLRALYYARIDLHPVLA